MNRLDYKNISSSVGMARVVRFGKLVVTFFSKKGRVFILLVSLLSLSTGIIPLYYSWIAQMPKLEDVYYSSGALVVKKLAKGDRQIGLKNNGTIEYFSCASSVASRHSGCGIKNELLNDWAGKNAEIGWFNQPVYLFYSQRKLIWLRIDGDEKISLSKSEKLMLIDGSDAPIFIFFHVLFLIFLIVSCEIFYTKGNFYLNK
ncbi:hypothetical protein V2I52_22035 [Brenneria sp. g21c3]|uniref:hypothetical protein n=1 Tax=Brenneria sp. g21c3 TaxID=3093893 RepID=UPI002E990065|nr:hypothetical protein [Brenneria sp. g21c3]